MSLNEKLASLKIDVTKPPKAIGSYVAYKIINKFIYISGQLPFKSDGSLIKGKVGQDINLVDAQNAARFCCINVLAQLNQACGGNLNLVKNCIKITGYVNSTDTFVEQPKVINPISELLVEIFGDRGKHSRVVVSVNSLPLGVPLEVESIFEIT